MPSRPFGVLTQQLPRTRTSQRRKLGDWQPTRDGSSMLRQVALADRNLARDEVESAYIVRRIPVTPRHLEESQRLAKRRIRG
jgi:hypothetical protein